MQNILLGIPIFLWSMKLVFHASLVKRPCYLCINCAPNFFYAKKYLPKGGKINIDKYLKSQTCNALISFKFPKQLSIYC